MKTTVPIEVSATFPTLQSENACNTDFQDAVIAYLRGDRKGALKSLEAARLGASPTISPSAACEQDYLECLINFSTGALDAAQVSLERLRTASELDNSSRWLGMSCLAAAAIQNELGHYNYAADLLARAEGYLLTNGMIGDIARLRYQSGVNLVARGDDLRARNELEAALHLARHSNERYVEATTLIRLGVRDCHSGNFERARERYQSAEDILERLGATRKLGQLRFSSAVLLIVMGNLNHAESELRSANELYYASAGEVPRSRWLQVRGWLSLRRGNITQARRELLEALERFIANDTQRDEALTYEFLGDVEVADGNLTRAREFYQKGLSIGRMVSATSDIVAECLRKLAEVDVRNQNLQGALSCVRSAVIVGRVYRDRLELAALRRVRAQVALRRSKYEYGLNLLYLARAEFAALPASIEVAETDRMISEEHERQRGVDRPYLYEGPKDVEAAHSEGAGEIAPIEGIVSRDPRVAAALRLAMRAAPTKLPVLVLGETGSGKELLAEAVHRHSGRTGQYLTINCAALPPDILDGELFGSARGAFTGAVRDRAGLIEAANDGTLFLDEVGEMSPAVQGRLLRAIELGEVRRLGENRTRRVNTRFVSATHRDLERMVAAGEFRADLFFRLRGVVIAVPPLRERVGDVDLLVDHFLAATEKGRSIRLTPEARQRLGSHAWPGNVRELKSVIERVVELSSEGATIHPDELGLEPIRIAGSLAEHLEEEERRRVLSTLESLNWNRSRAARALNMKRTTLLTKLKRLGINAPERPKTPPTH